MEVGLYSGNPRTPGTGNMIVRKIERFAALVAEHERNRLWTQKHWTDYEIAIAKKAAADERDACARLVEQYTGAWDDKGYALAQAIRQRGKE